VTLAAARLAVPQDAASVEALRVAALVEIDALRGGERYPVRTLPAPGDPARPLWVGEIAGTVVGFLAASRSGTTGTVDAVYVDAQCRAVGVGAAMLDAAVAWMRAMRCDAVDATALPGARQTKNFFEEAGLTARLLVVHRRL